MEDEGREAVRSALAEMEDRALQRLVALEQDEWDAGAVVVAQEILSERGIPSLAAEDYLDAHPEERIGESGFCLSCEADTVDAEHPPQWLRFLVGMRLKRSRARCPRCRSRPARIWWWFVPLGHYRVINEGTGVTTSRHLSRMIRPEVINAGSARRDEYTGA